VKVSSWQYYEVSSFKLLSASGLLALLGGVGVFFSTRDLLGDETWVASVLSALVIAYLLLSEPKRDYDSVSLWQAREAPLIASSAAISLEATGSKGRTAMLLNSRSHDFSVILADIKRRILLGYPPTDAIVENSRKIASESGAQALISLATHNSTITDDQGSEAESSVAAAALGEETKTPIFIAVCFFAPIMLLLFAIIGHKTGPLDLAELVTLQAIILNLAFAISSRERARVLL